MPVTLGHRTLQMHVFCFLLIAISFGPGATERLGSDGLCSLYAFLPYTADGSTSCLGCFSDGFSQMAAVLLAMDHFNQRNTSIVPELERYQECPVKFDFSSSHFFNTGTSADKIYLERLVDMDRRPCAAVGPFSNHPALELGTMAAAMRFPLTIHRAYTYSAVDPVTNPFSTQVFPDILSTSQSTAELLQHKGRTSYIAMLYPLTEMGTQWREALGITLDEYNMDNLGYPYNADAFDESEQVRPIDGSVQAVKDSGYRTIVVTTGNAAIEVPEIAKAAKKVGLLDGEYMWVFAGDFDSSLIFSPDDLTRELLTGALLILPQEHIWARDDPFMKVWKDQGPDAARRLNEFNPVSVDKDEASNLAKTQFGFSVSPTTPGYILAHDDLFEYSEPQFGSGFIYDAVIATGMGACDGLNGISENDAVPLASFVENIRSVDFQGASGQVKFGCADKSICPYNGNRSPSTMNWVAWNMFRPGSEDPFVEVDRLSAGASSFVQTAETIYGDGRNAPPRRLRDLPEQNYLPRGVRIFGLVCMSVALFCAFATMIWVFVHREHRVVRASQPVFLYAICFGSALTSTSIFTISHDESYGFSEQRLSRYCMATPWLFSLGYIITYGALFGKLWRINQVLQLTRRKIEVRQVAWPALALVAIALVILCLWTALDSLRWVRHQLDAGSGETIGNCSGDHTVAFTLPLLLVMLIPTLLTEGMAYLTKDVDEEYAESKWIFIMILVQCEAILFSAPMVILLREVSTAGRYLGMVILMWTFPMSTLGLIIGPKIKAFWQGPAAQPVAVRGSSKGAVRVTGLETPNLSRQHDDSHSRDVPDSKNSDGGRCL